MDFESQGGDCMKKRSLTREKSSHSGLYFDPELEFTCAPWIRQRPHCSGSSEQHIWVSGAGASLTVRSTTSGSQRSLPPHFAHDSWSAMSLRIAFTSVQPQTPSTLRFAQTSEKSSRIELNWSTRVDWQMLLHPALASLFHQTAGVPPHRDTWHSDSRSR